RQCVDEHPHAQDPFGKLFSDPYRLIERDTATRSRPKVEPNRVHARVGASDPVFDPRDATNLDLHRNSSRNADPGEGVRMSDSPTKTASSSRSRISAICSRDEIPLSPTRMTVGPTCVRACFDSDRSICKVSRSR